MRLFLSLTYLSLYLCSFVFYLRPVLASYIGSGLGDLMSASADSQSCIAILLCRSSILWRPNQESSIAMSLTDPDLKFIDCKMCRDKTEGLRCEILLYLISPTTFPLA